MLVMSKATSGKGGLGALHARSNAAQTQKCIALKRLRKIGSMQRCSIRGGTKSPAVERAPCMARNLVAISLNVWLIEVPYLVASWPLGSGSFRRCQLRFRGNWKQAPRIRRACG